MSTKKKQSLSAITLAAIGVVFGDIGTSPLYTLRECFSGYYGFDVRPDVVFGFLSLIFWILVVIVSLKYLAYVMRADNAGEGGILTLMVRKLDPFFSFRSEAKKGDRTMSFICSGSTRLTMG